MSFPGFNIPDFVPKEFNPKELMPKDLRHKVASHMAVDPSTLPVVTEQFERYNQANLQLALDVLCSASAGRPTSILGIQPGIMGNVTGTALKDIIAPASISHFVGLGGAREGSVQYTNIKVSGEKDVACIQGGLYLVSGEPKLTLLLRQNSMMDFAGRNSISLDIMAHDKSTAENFLRKIHKQMLNKNIYRGKVLSVIGGNQDTMESGSLQFHDLPKVGRDQIILPDDLLRRIERQTVDVGKYRDALLKAKRKLKRGILLHGKPGTGKTLTAMYLASSMPDRTVLLMTGPKQGLMQSTCQFARWLEPATVIIEDVDLIAEERSAQNGCAPAILLELLNQMDGLANDVDVLFLLTTNRPEILEPALASRPGRVDQAYEVPLPGDDERRRLFELYCQGLKLKDANIDKFVKRTSGASGAFIAELMRKAAIFAAPDGEEIEVGEDHLDEAMHELLIAGGKLTKNLLGSNNIGFNS